MDTESIFLYPNLRLYTVSFGDFQILMSVFGARVGGLDTFHVSQLEESSVHFVPQNGRGIEIGLGIHVRLWSFEIRFSIASVPSTHPCVNTRSNLRIYVAL